MKQISCTNCWYNGLQYGTIGLVGYCVEHDVLLRQGDFTTCGRHRRKDLLLTQAMLASRYHAQRYPPDRVVDLDGEPLLNGKSGYITHEVDYLKSDEIAKVVGEYGQLNSKISSLAQLRRIPNGRAELALLSLGRAYVSRCMERGGRWTSGLHLLWWARERLIDRPHVDPLHDFRIQLSIELHRQVELAQWSLIMLRLSFITDVAQYAGEATDGSALTRELGEKVAALRELAENAAEVASTDLAVLLQWLQETAEPHVAHAFPWEKYRMLSLELHREDD